MPRSSSMARSLRPDAALILLIGLGCSGAPIDPPDAGPPPCPSAPCDAPTPVDLLIVVEVADFSSAPRGLIAAGAPVLLESLSHGGPGASLQVGVVYSDMGGDRYLGAGCAPGDGFDGVLQPPMDMTDERCDATSERFQVVTSPADVEGASVAVACSLWPGLDRCQAQSFEAMLKALAPSTSAIDFRGETGGHADTENAGFLRDDAVLAILFVGTHDDCSLEDLRHVEHGAPRCADGRICCEERLFDVDRYLSGLASLGRRRIIVSALTGIPGDLAPRAGDANELRAVLAHPDMQTPTSPLCIHPFVEDAWPAPRVTRLAAACPGVVRSVCEATIFDEGLDRAMAEIGGFIAREACHPE